MASIKDPRNKSADDPTAPEIAATRASESLCEQGEAPDAQNAQTTKPAKPPAVDFSQVQARYG